MPKRPRDIDKKKIFKGMYICFVAAIDAIKRIVDTVNKSITN
jgi:hypothetical protein